MAETGTRIAVWDIPVRLFHWSLAGLIAFAWWSAETHHLDWHKIAGSLIAGLLVFRLWWGVFGGSTARFADFVRGPGAILDYLRGKAKGLSAGHNPLGALSVLALLLAALTVVVSGLFTVDTDGIESGPLSNLVDFDQGRIAAEIHGYGFNVLEVLVVLHLVAIAWYAFVKRDGLIGAMLHGKRTARGEMAAMKPARLWALVVGLILGGGVAAYLIHLSALS
ncbi:cytochrome b/b6 domain-containing protein [Asticcacaulis solisilvae]|uniref:cytochrome b/b6 domain-containing protein n=1 Tax=Asticcacaulis solisilvae TaxID=1217274 RepID=UPI003FD850F1